MSRAYSNARSRSHPTTNSRAEEEASPFRSGGDADEVNRTSALPPEITRRIGLFSPLLAHEREAELRERIWFNKPNLRLRSTIEQPADGLPGRASFSSEIRRVSKPAAA